jgi:hypothetical protein
MQLVEQHVIDRNDPRFTVIDQAAFASKNLYNAALYELRQAFILPFSATQSLSGGPVEVSRASTAAQL